MNKKWPILLSIGLLIIFLDQSTKIWVDHLLGQTESRTVIPSYFELVHYRNPGAAFGMFASWASPWRETFFYCVSALAMSFLIYYFIKTPVFQKNILVSLSMIIGGALGNLIDRIFRGNVVDFLLFHWNNKVARFSIFGKNYILDLVWPAFNIADAAISVGVLLLIVFSMRAKE